MNKLTHSINGVLHLTGKDGYTLHLEPSGHNLLVSLRFKGREWCKFIATNQKIATKRAYELINSIDDILEPMKVTKEHTLQVGDIVNIKTPFHKGLGIIQAIQSDTYWVSFVEIVDGIYRKKDHENCFELENLKILPDREKWVFIKRDIDRAKDGTILMNWINKL